MRVLITGGAGFIGSHTADALLLDGVKVRVLDSLEEPVHPGHRAPAYLDPRIEMIRGDVRDPGMLEAALAGCDAVYHLAAYQDYLPDFSHFFDVNVTSTALLYELIEREQLPVRKVIVASSQATLGEGLYRDADGRECLPDLRPDHQLAQGIWEVQPAPGQRGPLQWQPTDESWAHPQNAYGLSKLGLEQVALGLGRRYEIPTVAMRYSIVQGPRQSFTNAYSGACRVFCLSFHVGREPVIYEDGQQVRDFVNIQDVVEANLLVLHDARADHQKLHVGGERAVTVADFARTVAEAFGVRDYEPVASGLYRFGDTRHICSDVSRLRALGWKPRRSIEESVAAYRDWLRSAAELEPILERSQRKLESLSVVRRVRS
ncbi:MAG: NAD-dependent epimerase/dehydratase family protein [Myxococcota bacterium]